jgi:hypothetical protein
MRFFLPLLLVIVVLVWSGGAAELEAETRERPPRSETRSEKQWEFRFEDTPHDVASTQALPENLFWSLEEPCRNRETFSFEILDPMDPSGFWELFPKLPRIMEGEGVDALIIPFTQPRGTDLVLFRSMDTMDRILARPTTFLMETGKLRSHRSMARPEKKYERINGHDLEESLLRAFATRLAEEESGFKLPGREGDTVKLCQEREFWEEYLIARIERNDHLILVGGSFEDVLLEGTLSHELLHAVFYSDERTQRLVAEFWDTKVTDSDKRGMIDTFERAGYEVKKNPKMLHNEFMAYLLERTASKKILKSWVPVYSAELRKHLTDAAVVLP